VAGGSLLRGKLRIDEEIEIRPGLITKTAAGDIFVKPLRTKVRALLSETNKLGTAWPGGLIGVGTGLDPTLTKGDRLVGHVLGHAGTLPPVYSTIVVSYYMMKRLVGAASVGADGKRSSRPAKLAKGDEIKVNIHSRTARARVLAVKEDLVRLSLEIPCCMEDNQRIAINRRVENTNKWALVAFGAFLKEQSKPLELQI
jgi:translation initiation factor 2 subunit 3